MAIKEGLIAHLKSENKATRKMLEHVPTEHFDFKPHPKSSSLIKLSAHIANLPLWLERILNSIEFSIGEPLAPQTVPNTSEELMQLFEANAANAIELLENTSEENLRANWTLKKGDQVIFNLPRFVAIRSSYGDHLIHHRGQLSVYLRLLDIPVPNIYGPTADEM